MRRLIGTLLLAIAALASLPDEAAAQSCQARIEGLGRISVSRSYDPLDGRTIEQQDEATIRRVSGSCDFALGASPGQASGATRQMSQGAARLGYELYAGRNRSRPLRDADTGGPGSMVLGQFNGRSSVDIDIDAVVPEGQMIAAGSYSDSVIFTLYELVGGVPGRVLDSRSVQVTANVSAVAGFEVIIEGARKSLRSGLLGKLDFGEITAGRRMGFELEVRGNLGYDIELSSENGGVLRGQGYARESTIPYRLYLDGRGLDLGRSAQVGEAPATDFGRTLNTHRFEVEIGNLGNASAGKYRDDLTLTVITR